MSLEKNVAKFAAWLEDRIAETEDEVRLAELEPVRQALYGFVKDGLSNIEQAFFVATVKSRRALPEQATKEGSR